MVTLKFACVAGLIVTGLLGVAALADVPASPSSQRRKNSHEELVFVTGSLIPQRIQVQAIGTTTSSSIRVINRDEIDQSGRRTTTGALVNEPSIQVSGR